MDDAKIQSGRRASDRAPPFSRDPERFAEGIA
jgi:hypothetical protein